MELRRVVPQARSCVAPIRRCPCRPAQTVDAEQGKQLGSSAGDGASVAGGGASRRLRGRRVGRCRRPLGRRATLRRAPSRAESPHPGVAAPTSRRCLDLDGGRSGPGPNLRKSPESWSGQLWPESGRHRSKSCHIRPTWTHNFGSPLTNFGPRFGQTWPEIWPLLWADVDQRRSKFVRPRPKLAGIHWIRAELEAVSTSEVCSVDQHGSTTKVCSMPPEEAEQQLLRTT